MEVEMARGDPAGNNTVNRSMGRVNKPKKKRDKRNIDQPQEDDKPTGRRRRSKKQGAGKTQLRENETKKVE